MTDQRKDGQTERKEEDVGMNGWIDRQMYCQNRWTETDVEINRKIDRQTDIQTDRNTYKSKKRQSD